MHMKLQPTKGHLVIKPYEKPKEVSGLMLAGDDQNAAPVRGDILETGEESKFTKGETIYFRRYAVDELKYIEENGREETVWLVDEREVLAVLRT